MEGQHAGSSQSKGKGAALTLLTTTSSDAIIPTSTETGEKLDYQIFQAIARINRLSSAVESQAKTAIALVTQRAEKSQQWVKDHEDDLKNHAAKLSEYIGVGADPDTDQELEALLKPIEMPAGLFDGTQQAKDAVEVEDDAEDALPGPSTKRKNPNTSDNKPKKKQERSGSDEGVRGIPKSDKTKKKMPIHHHLDKCSAVVLTEKGGYVELRCDKCGGNSGRVSKKFLSGIRGFNKHFRSAHNESPGPPEIIKRCAMRDVGAEEAHDIESGEESPDRHEADIIEDRTEDDTIAQFLNAGESASWDGDFSVYPYSPKPYAQVPLRGCEAVVQGVFVELRCNRCGGNAYYRRGYLNGIDGFQAHYYFDHGVCMEKEDVLKECCIRYLTDSEVNDIRHGILRIPFRPVAAPN
ncbi:hypothetical protein Q7P37_005917 [Cladosporium fusiforme]